MVTTRGKTTKQPDETLTKFIKEVVKLDETNDIFKLMADSDYLSIVDIISADDERLMNITTYS